MNYKEGNIEYFYVGTVSPLWCCKHAMNKKHECVYCECQDCHKRDGTPPRPKRQKVDAVNKNNCDHDVLEPETRSEYFSMLYLQACIRKGAFTPSHCSKCLKLLTGVRHLAVC